MRHRQFIYGTPIDGVSETDYETVVPGIIVMAEAMNKCLPFGCSIDDNYRQECIYISDHWHKHFGVEPGFFGVPKNMEGSMLKVEKDFYRTCIMSAHQFVERLPVEERIHQVLSFPLTVRMNGMMIRLHHRITPIALSRTGKVWLTLCTSFPATNKLKDKAFLCNRKTGVCYVLNSLNSVWTEVPHFNLDKRQKQILLLAAQGTSIQDIAAQLDITVDMVKTSRRRIFETLGVDNIQEAITFTMNECCMTR